MCLASVLSTHYASAQQGDFETLYAEGEELYKQGKYREATEAFERALSLLSPEDSAAVSVPVAMSNSADGYERVFLEGKTFYRRHDFNRAEAAFKQALKLKPDSREAQQWLATTQEARSYKTVGGTTLDASEATGRSQQLQSDQKNISAELRQLQKELASKNSQIEDLQEALERESRQLKEIMEEGSVDGKSAHLKDRVKELKQERSRLKDEVSDLNKKNIRLSRELDDVKRELADLEIRVNAKSLRSDEALSITQQQNAVLDARITELSADLREKDTMLRKLQASLEQRDLVTGSSQERVNQLLGENHDFKEQIKKLQASLREQQAFNDDLLRRKSEKSQVSSDLNNQLKLARQEIDVKTEALEERAQQLTILQERLQSQNEELRKRGMQSAELEARLNSLSSTQSVAASKNSQMAKELSSAKTQIDQLTEQLMEAQKAHGEKSRNEKRFELKANELEAAMSALREERDQLSIQLANVKNNNQRLERSLQLAENDPSEKRLSKELKRIQKLLSDRDRQLSIAEERLVQLEDQLGTTHQQKLALEQSESQQTKALKEFERENARLTQALHEVTQNYKMAQSNLAVHEEKLDTTLADFNNLNVEREKEVTRLNGVISEQQKNFEKLAYDLDVIKSERDFLNQQVQLTSSDSQEVTEQFAKLQNLKEQQDRQLGAQQVELDKQNEKLLNLEQELFKRDTQLEQTAAELEDIKKNNIQLAKTNDDLMKQLSQHSAKLEVQGKSNVKAEAALEDAQERNKRLADEQVALREQLAMIQQQYEGGLKKINSVERERTLLQDKLAQVSSELNHMRDLQKQMSKVDEKQTSKVTELQEVVSQLSKERKELAEKLDDTQRSNKNLKKLLEETEANFASNQQNWNGSVEQLSAQLSQRELVLENTEAELLALKQTLSEVRQERALLEERLFEREANLAQLHQNIETLGVEHGNEKKALIEAQQQIRIYEGRLADTNTSLAAKEEQLAEIHQQLRDMQRVNLSLQSENENLSVSLGDRESELDRLQGSLSEDQQVLTRLNSDYEEVDAERRTLKDRVASLEKERQNLTEEVTGLRGTSEKYFTEISQLRNEANERKDVLLKTQEALAETTRKLEKNQRQFAELKLVHEELSEVHRNQEKKAKDRAALVVDAQNELNQARLAIDHLSSQVTSLEKERALFSSSGEELRKELTEAQKQIATLTADTNKSKQLNQQLTKELQHVRELSEQMAKARDQQTIRAEDVSAQAARLKNENSQLLAKLNDLAGLKNELENKLRIAEEDFTATQRRWSNEMTLSTNTVTKLTQERDQNLERADKLLKELMHVRQLNEQLSSTQEERAAHLNGLTLKNRELEQDRERMVKDLEGMNANLKELEARLERSMQAREESDGQWRMSMDDLTQQLMQSNMELEKLQGLYDQAQAKLETAQNNGSTLVGRLDERNVQLMELEGELVLTQQRNQDVQVELEEMKQERAVLNERLKDRETKLQENVFQVAELKKNLDAMQKLHSVSSTEVERLQDDLNNKNSELGRLRASLSEDQSVLKRLNTDYAQVDKERKELKIALQEVTAEKERQLKELSGLRSTSSKYFDEISQLRKDANERKEILLKTQEALAETARKFKDVDQRYAQLALVHEELAKVHADLKQKSKDRAGMLVETTDELQQARMAIDEMSERILSVESLRDQLQSENTDLRARFTDSEERSREMASKLNEADQLNNQLTLEVDRVRDLNVQLARTRDQQAGRAQELSEELVRLQSENGQLSTKVQDLVQVKADFERQLKIAEEDFRQTQLRWSEEMAQATNTLTTVSHERDTSLGAQKQLRAELDHTRELNLQLNKTREEQDAAIRGLKAQVYEVSQERERLVADLSSLEIRSNELERELNETTKTQETINADWRMAMEQVSSKLMQKDTELTTIREQYEMAKKTLEQTQRQESVLASRLDERNAQLMNLEGQYTTTQQELKAVEQEKKGLQTQLAVIQNQVSERTQHLKERDAQLVQLQERLNSIQRLQAVSQTEMEKLQLSLRTKDDELFRLRRALTDDQEALEQLTKDYDELIKVRDNYAQKIRTDAQNLEQLTEELVGLRSTSSKYFEEIGQLKDQLNARHGSLLETQETLAQTTQQLNTVQLSYEDLNVAHQRLLDEHARSVKDLEESESNEFQHQQELAQTAAVLKDTQERVEMLEREKMSLAQQLDTVREKLDVAQANVGLNSEELRTLQQQNQQLADEVTHVRTLNEQLAKARDAQSTRSTDLTKLNRELETDKEQLLNKVAGLVQSKSTLESRVASLQEDFAKAQLRWAEELEQATNLITLREDEMRLARSSLKEAESTSIKLQREKTSLDERLSQRTDAIVQKDEVIKELQDKLRDQEKAMFAAQSHSQQALLSMENKESDIRRLSTLLEQREKQLDQIRAERDQFNTQAAEFSASLQAIEQERLRLQAQVDTFRQANRGIEEQLRLGQGEFTQAQARWMEEIETLNRELARKDTEMATIKANAERVQRTASTEQEQRVILEARLREIEEHKVRNLGELERLKKQYENTQQALQKSEQQAAVVRKQLDERSQLLETREIELLQMRDRISYLESNYAASSTESSQLNANVASLKEELTRLRRQLVTEQQTVDRLKKESGDIRVTSGNLEEQVRIAKETQQSLQAELRSKKLEVGNLQEVLLATQADRDRFRSGIEQRETSIGQLQAEVNSLRRNLTAAESELKQYELASHEKQQQMIVDREGNKWQIDRLQRELERAQESYRDLVERHEAQMKELTETQVKLEDVERLRNSLLDSQREVSRLKESLAERERVVSKLHNSLSQREMELEESQSALVQTHEMLGVPAQAPVMEQRAVPSQTINTSSASSDYSLSLKTEALMPSLDQHSVKIYRANPEHGFVVISTDNLNEPHQGDTLTLYVADEAVAEVKLGEIDSTGMALAYVQKMINPDITLRPGDIVTAGNYAKQ